MSATIPLAPFDADIVRWLNSGLGRNPEFDHILHQVNGNALLKGVPFMIVIWWLGSGGGRWRPEERDFLTRTIFGLLLALLVARVLQNVGPRHVRPFTDPTLGLKVFMQNDWDIWRKDNSFPSDHAVQFFAVSFAIATQRLWLGMVAFAWSLVFICLPRMYFGYHYPSDVLAGAVVGVALMALALGVQVPKALQAGFERFRTRAPGVLQAAQFGLAMEMANNFDDLRAILRGLNMA